VLAGVPVTFETGGPPGATIERASAVTDQFGVASPGTWTLASVAGIYTLTARAGDVLYSTVSARVYETFPVSAIAAGPGATCANARSGETYCWGFGSALPTRIQGDERFVSLTVGSQFACGLTAEGAASCWGRDIAASPSAPGSPIIGLPQRIGADLLFRRISAGGTLACGLSMDGRAYCWGENQYGQLGNGTTAASAVPQAVTAGLTFVDLSAGYWHACGVTTSGETYCWGVNEDRELGTPSSQTCDVVEYDYYTQLPIVVHTPCSSVPLRVTAVPQLAAVSAAQGTCGLGTDGAAFCWGRGDDVELVSPTVRFVNIVATQLLVAKATSPLPMLGASLCGTATSGGVLCGNVDELVAVAPTLTFSALVSGGNHACGVTRDSGLAYCWGANSVGELGNGTLRTTSVPTPVAAP
jgi:alpha-tubulin suppressor-like RCC1 family protein